VLPSIVLYVGLTLTTVGLIFAVKPVRGVRIGTRPRALAVIAAGVAAAAIGLLLPVSESRIRRAATRLDEFAPVWQFSEFHTATIAAPPARVYDAITRVRADEILLFRTLTWIRRGGRPGAPGILNAGGREALIDVALHSGFVRLADDPPRELVVGTVVVAPRGARGPVTPEVFHKRLPPGFALATMNFLVTPDGEGGSLLSTETRVYANSAPARWRFAAYWHMIYPGSSIIRRMWLRAIDRRATSAIP
jgi:hypothetical protein